MHCSGGIVAIVMDYVWLPSNFISRLRQFYSEHPLDILGFPEVKLSVPPNLLNHSALLDSSALSIFTNELAVSPLTNGWNISLGPFPPTWRNESEFRYSPTYYELYCASFPWKMIAEINGFDEMLDYGNGTIYLLQLH